MEQIHVANCSIVDIAVVFCNVGIQFFFYSFLQFFVLIKSVSKLMMFLFRNPHTRTTNTTTTASSSSSIVTIVVIILYKHQQ